MKNVSKKTLALLIVLAMLLTLLSACGGKQNGPSGSSSIIEELRIGSTKGYGNFGNFYESGAYAYTCVASTVQQAFWQLDEKNNIVPDFFREWEVSDDNMEMVCKFDKNATWSNGKPVTAQDVKFTFDYHMSVIKNDYTSQLKSCEIVDDTTVKFTFIEPAAFAFLYKCAGFVYPVPEEVWKDVAEPKTYTGEGAVIGCGPYVLGETDEDAQTFTLIARDDYYLGAPVVKKITVKNYDSQETLALALKNKEVDCMQNYSAGLTATLSSAFSNVDYLDPGMSDNPGNIQLEFGSAKAPCNDVAFRNAVSYALDHQLIATTVGGDYGTVAGRGVIAPTCKGFDASIAKLTQDTDKANKILDEAGYKDVNGDGIREDLNGQAMSVSIVPQWNATKKELYLRLAEIIIANLKNVGINAYVDQQSIENQDYYRQVALKDHSYEMLIVTNTTGIANFKTAFFYCQGKYGTWGNWNDEKLITAYDAMLCSSDFDEYCNHVKELQAFNDENVLAISLGWDKVFYPYRTDVFTGWVNYPGSGPVCYRTWFDLKAK